MARIRFLDVFLSFAFLCTPAWADEGLDRYLTTDLVWNFELVSPVSQILLLKAFDVLEIERPPTEGSTTHRRSIRIFQGVYESIAMVDEEPDYFLNPAAGFGSGVTVSTQSEIHLPLSLEELPEEQALALLVPFLRTHFPHKWVHPMRYEKLHKEWVARMQREGRLAQGKFSIVDCVWELFARTGSGIMRLVSGG